MTSHAQLVLDGEWTRERAPELRRELEGALERADVVELDLGGVGEIDTIGVQVLLAAKRSADLRQKELRILQESEAVRDVCDLLNLRPLLGFPLLFFWSETDA